MGFSFVLQSVDNLAHYATIPLGANLQRCCGFFVHRQTKQQTQKGRMKRLLSVTLFAITLLATFAFTALADETKTVPKDSTAPATVVATQPAQPAMTPAPADNTPAIPAVEKSAKPAVPANLQVLKEKPDATAAPNTASPAIIEKQNTATTPATAEKQADTVKPVSATPAKPVPAQTPTALPTVPSGTEKPAGTGNT